MGSIWGLPGDIGFHYDYIRVGFRVYRWAHGRGTAPPEPYKASFVQSDFVNVEIPAIDPKLMILGLYRE